MLGFVDAGFFLLVGISFLVAEFVDRTAAGPGKREDPGTLSNAGTGTFMIMFGIGIVILFSLLDFRSPFIHPFADMTPAGGDFGKYDSVPAIIGWSIPVLFGLWGISKLSKSELNWVNDSD